LERVGVRISKINLPACRQVSKLNIKNQFQYQPACGRQVSISI